MMTAYAFNGLFGLLTPQANTTVEPEFQALCPPGIVALTARMTSDKPDMDDRLRDYVAHLDETVARFANAPLGAVALACTGMSYLVAPEAERRALDGIAARRGCPVLTAAGAIMDALDVLSARRVGVLSPYGDSLHAQAMRFWAACGLDIVRVERLGSDAGAFHPIYAMSGGAASEGLRALGSDGIEAVLILGTGLPTLATLLERRAEPVPVLTPNLALMWRTSVALAGKQPDRDDLRPWLTGAAWERRYAERMAPDAAG